MAGRSVVCDADASGEATQLTSHGPVDAMRMQHHEHHANRREFTMKLADPMKIEPTILRGSVVRLEPLTLDHLDALVRVGLEPELWRWIPNKVHTAEDMRIYVQTALDEQQRNVSLPFVIIDQASNQVIGCTRYANIEASHRRLEIGWTWLTPSQQRSGANTDAKLLLLTHAFDVLGANRVELKSDSLNEKSRTAIARLGAKEEGIFRNHMIIPETGRVRHTVYFSIIDSEWPAIKANLTARLRNATPAP
jgi:RimJ/RimL family protein N-acetyltransferase